MGQHRLNFVRGEPLEQALTHGDQRIVSVPAGGERVGLIGWEDTDLGHLDAGIAGKLLDSLQ